jgi:hypothetical protein
MSGDWSWDLGEFGEAVLLGALGGALLGGAGAVIGRGISAARSAARGSRTITNSGGSTTTTTVRGGATGARSSTATSARSSVTPAGNHLTQNYSNMANILRSRGYVGNHTVYMSRGGDYVGITGRILKFRAREHERAGRLLIDREYTILGLNKAGAKMIEQAVIGDLGLKRFGGILLNVRNSISTRNPLYKTFISFFGGK